MTPPALGVIVRPFEESDGVRRFPPVRRDRRLAGNEPYVSLRFRGAEEYAT